MLIDRPPITQGWHLIVLLVVGVFVVALVHRVVKRRVAERQRRARAQEDA